MSNSRLEFEQAVNDSWTHSFDFERGDDSYYCNADLARMWWGWKAGRQALEGEVVAYKYWWKESPRIEAVCKQIGRAHV